MGFFEFSKVTAVDPYATSARLPDPTYNKVVEVVLIDKTHFETEPAVFQLDINLANFENLSSLWTCKNEQFISLGVFSSLNKAGKQVILADGSCIIYRYLILAKSNSQSPSQRDVCFEFSGGLFTLLSALKLQIALLHFYEPQAKKPLGAAPHGKVNIATAPSESIPNIVSCQMKQQDLSGSACGLAGSDKKFFQVQV